MSSLRSLPSSDAGAAGTALAEAGGLVLPRYPAVSAVPTLCSFSCSLTISSLFSWNRFSFQRPGLGRNWDR